MAEPMTPEQAAERLAEIGRQYDILAERYGFDLPQGQICRMGVDALRREQARTSHGYVQGCPCPGCDPKGAGEHVQELLARVAELEALLDRHHAYIAGLRADGRCPICDHESEVAGDG